MKTLVLTAAACLLGSSLATAQVPDAPPPAPTIAAPPSADEMRAPRPARARGIPAALAIEAAQTAIASCLDSGYKVTSLITDSAGVPIALISGEGAAAITQRVAMSKVQAVLKYKMSSGEVAAKAKTDPALMAQLAADPLIGTARQGALPLMSGTDLVGVFAVSGAPGGDKDEVCVTAGIGKIRDRLK
jgi:uncharacterized protein GlcG (DUF336 family)